VTTIQSAFGDTPLAGPVLDVLNCILLMKVQGIQDGLTFVNENAQVQFPRVDTSTTASLENLSVVQSTDGSSLATILNAVVDKWLDSIRQQAIVAGILFSLYCLIVCIGYGRVLYVMKRTARSGGRVTRFWDLRSTTGLGQKVLEVTNPFEDAPYPTGPGPTPAVYSKR
jgi:hypothetical protein